MYQNKMNSVDSHETSLTQTIIGVDLVGGDYGLSSSLAACLSCLEKHPELVIHGYMDEESRIEASHPRLIVKKRENRILHKDSVLKALRKKETSTLGGSLMALRDGEVDAVISAGNTAAIMALSMKICGLYRNAKRAAIAGTMVSYTETPVFLVDGGANVDVSPDLMVNLAEQSLHHLSGHYTEKPRIAILNNGVEPTKGNKLTQDSYRLFESKFDNFVGFVEPYGIVHDQADIIIADGFVGNILVKASEETTKYFMKALFAKLKERWHHRMMLMMMRPKIKQTLNDLWRNILYGQFIGINGLIIKLHGSADVTDYINSIDRTFLQLRNSKIKRCQIESQ